MRERVFLVLLSSLFLLSALSFNSGAAVTVDSFNPILNADVQAMALQPDGKILIGGLFTSVNSVGRSHIARLNSDASLDAFNPGANEVPRAIAVQPDGKIIVGGRFTSIAGQARNYIARLNYDGTLDVSFNTNVSGYINSIVTLPNGQILIGGEFTTVDGLSCTSVARLNVDGSLDLSFNTSFNGPIYSIAVQSDSKIIAGGQFTTVGGQSRYYLVRLDPDGSVDTSYNPDPNGIIYSVAVQADDRVLVGGIFSRMGVHNPWYRVAMLDSSGSVDTSFSPGITNNTIRSLGAQADGKILVGGDFSLLGDENRSYVGRFYSDGNVDTGFDYTHGTDNKVFGLAVQQDGKILVNGEFSTLGGISHASIGRLVDSDGSIEQLAVTGNSEISWTRGGIVPEFSRTWFEYSIDQFNWIKLGDGVRIDGGWELAGTSLPVNQTFYVRGRGTFSSGIYNGSESLIETEVQTYITGHVINSSAGINGFIEPSGDVIVVDGESQAFTISADPNYHIADVLVDGESIGAQSQHTFSNVDSNHAIEASFAIDRHQLTVTKTGSGDGYILSLPDVIISCGGTCNQEYDYGSQVELRVFPDTGTTFTGWSGGGCSGTTPACLVTVDRAQEVTAGFARDYHNLFVAKSGLGRGTVTASEGDIACESFCLNAYDEYTDGTVVTLRVSNVPPGSIFTGWSGGGCSGSGDCTVTMNDHITVIAQFDADTGYVNNSKAIILAGYGKHPTNWLWEETKLNTNHAYQVLLDQGFTRDKIFYLNSENYDVDGNGLLDDIDNDATLTNLQYAITTWAADAEDVVIYLADHGGKGTFVVSHTDAFSEVLHATDLSSWLDTLQQAMPGRVILVYEACYSGSFVEYLSSPYDRIIMTSSAANQKSKFVNYGRLSFSYQFWSVVYEGALIFDAFTHANMMMTAQTAWTDINGDGIANQLDDIFPDIVIGAGVHHATSTMPVVADAAPSARAGKSSKVLWADVVSGSSIKEVWALIIPPEYDPSSPDTPLEELPTVMLTDANGDGRFEGIYNSFSEKGVYQVSYYAMNEVDEISLPVNRTVQVSSFPWVMLHPILQPAQVQ